MKAYPIFFWLLTTALSFGFFQQTAHAQFEYTTNPDNTITITGYTGPGGNLTIPSTISNLTVSSIGQNVFFNNQTVTNLTISPGIIDIGPSAFAYMRNLVSASIPNGVTDIESGAFWSDFNLTTVTIPDSVTNIGSDAFEYCLSWAVIGNGVNAIGADAFASSTLTNIYFQGNLPASADPEVFGNYGNDIQITSATVYVYQGSLGWGTNFDGMPVIVLSPATTAPYITNQPQDVVTSAYSAASFSVTAYGTLPFSYQWCFNGSNILNANSSTLTIPSVQQPDLGAYTVIVANPFGSVTSSIANLYMYPYIESQFTGLDSYWGQTNTLEVGAWGSGNLTYQWYQNGIAVPDATNATLDFSSIQFTNAGLYSVIVSSSLGSATNSPYQVIVNPANVSLKICPDVVIQGTVGFIYTIESTTNLANPNAWTVETNLTLTQPVENWNDNNTPINSRPQKFYQVLPGQ